MRRRDAERFARKMVALDRRIRDMAYKSWWSTHEKLHQLEKEWEDAVDAFAAKHSKGKS